MWNGIYVVEFPFVSTDSDFIQTLWEREHTFLIALLKYLQNEKEIGQENTNGMSSEIKDNNVIKDNNLTRIYTLYKITYIIDSAKMQRNIICKIY